nr:MAG: hypothetical protein 1 [Leviviridae sp.]
MTDQTLATFREKSKLFGIYHSWWLPGAPQDAEFWTITEKSIGNKISISHRRSPDGVYREGGPFYVAKLEVDYTGAPVKTYRPNSAVPGLAYSGSYKCSTAENLALWFTFRGQGAEYAPTYAFGAQAIARLRPDKPKVDGILNILELKDLSHLLKLRTYKLKDRVRKEQIRRSRRAKSGGEARYWLSDRAGEYLAIQFGLLPLVGAAKDFLDAWKDEEKNLRQILKDAGKPVRRRGYLMKSTVVDSDVTSSSGASHNPSMAPVHVTACYAPGHGRTDKQVTTREVWFSGQSRYYLPEGPHTEDYIRQLKKRLYGSRLTASTIWNLLPWSFLADYFVGLGHFLKALDPSGVGDNFIIDYAYIMDTKKVQYTMDLWETTYSSRTSATQIVRARRVKTQSEKVRCNASIFGWGINQSDLSDKQLAILSALGASRL